MGGAGEVGLRGGGSKVSRSSRLSRLPAVGSKTSWGLHAISLRPQRPFKVNHLTSVLCVFGLGAVSQPRCHGPGQSGPCATELGAADTGVSKNPGPGFLRNYFVIFEWTVSGRRTGPLDFFEHCYAVVIFSFRLNSRFETPFSLPPLGHSFIFYLVLKQPWHVVALRDSFSRLFERNLLCKTAPVLLFIVGSADLMCLFSPRKNLVMWWLCCICLKELGSWKGMSQNPKTNFLCRANFCSCKRLKVFCCCFFKYLNFLEGFWRLTKVRKFFASLNLPFFY